MRTLLLFLSLFILTGCKEPTQPQNTPQKPSEAPTEASVAQLKEEHVAADFANLLAPLIDPAKLDTLKGKRAATPRLRKACYWLQMAHTAGFDIGEPSLILGGEETVMSLTDIGVFYNIENGGGIDCLFPSEHFWGRS